MTDSEVLFLCVAAVYLLQCAVYAHSGALVLCARRRGWSESEGTFTLGALHLNMSFASPLPPLRTAVVCDTPLRLSDRAVCLPSADEAVVVEYDSISSVTASGRTLRVNGNACKFSSATQAAAIADLLRRLKSAPQSEHAAIARAHIARSLDLAAAQSRMASVRSASRAVTVTANVLFFALFVAVPIVVALYGLLPTWPLLVGLLVSATLVTAVLFRRAHKKLYPSDSDSRWTHTLTIALSPLAAIRAADVLWRDAFAGFHHVTVARALCRPPVAARVLATFVRQLSFPTDTELGSAPSARALHDFYRTELLSHLKRRQSDEVAAALAQPSREPAALMYCPRCHAQYTVSASECSDCAGVQLVSFQDAPTAQRK